jgi:fatty acid desaturase
MQGISVEGDMNKPFTILAVLVFALVALAHLLRLVYGWEATINGAMVPMWLSIVGLLIAGGLAVMLWRESRK